MYKKVLLLLIVAIPFMSNAQFGNLLKKAKNKVEQRVENKIDKEMEKKLDEVEGKETPSANNSSTSTSTTIDQPKEEKPSIKSFSKFDFVPGEKILYAEDFAQDVIGELPLNWNSTGKGEVVSLDKQTGKWLRMFQNTTYLAGSNAVFGKDFTVEFDLLLPFKYYQYTFPLVHFGLLSSNDLPPADNSLLKDISRFQSADITLRAQYNYNTTVELKTFVERRDFFKGTDQTIENSADLYNKINHVAIQVQKTRLRVWINEQKVFDMPRALDTTHLFNQLYFRVGSSGYKEDAIGFFVSNFKVATGLPDTRHKLIEEGKFSTTGILFDVNAASIKPESNGVLKEVAEAIKSNAGIKIKIIGHTDSDGTDAANLELSKKRSQAVKAALVKDFGIDATTLETDGKGESVPMGDNKTKEGKAQNRRVEFVKI